VARSSALSASKEVKVASSAQNLYLQGKPSHTQIKLFRDFNPSNPDQTNKMLGNYINEQID
jgi:hypothetical protein